MSWKASTSLLDMLTLCLGTLPVMTHPLHANGIFIKAQEDNTRERRWSKTWLVALYYPINNEYVDISDYFMLRKDGGLSANRTMVWELQGCAIYMYAFGVHFNIKHYTMLLSMSLSFKCDLRTSLYIIMSADYKPSQMYV